MAKKEPKPEELMQHLSGALQLYGQAQIPVLNQFATLQDQRAKRLQKTEARIAVGLGESHPRAVALRQAQARTTELQRNLKDNASRTAKLRELKPYEWMVYGQVVDSEGSPVPDVTVRVYDKDRKYDDLLGYTTTDKYGDFQLIYHERAFYEPGEEAPELYLRVEDADGNELYSTEDQIRYESGRVEYFMIRLEKAKGRK
jgi:hypothetical protein